MEQGMDKSLELLGHTVAVGIKNFDFCHFFCHFVTSQFQEVEETGGPGKNHCLIPSHWELSHLPLLLSTAVEQLCQYIPSKDLFWRIFEGIFLSETNS